MNYIEEAEEYLTNYDNLKISLENLRMDVIELDETFKSIKAINYSGMPHGSGAGEPSDAILNKMFQRDQKKVMYDETLNVITRMEKIFANLQEADMKILRLWYIDGYRCEQLIKDLNCSESTIFRNKRKAIRVLAIQLFGLKGIA
ncbi:DUF1492 domain-containing protein [Clostridium estertheticum]|uniref:DUF1492 domain-containing protein n=1 Tax=Clostridium estertheticum TaxID=238834 RepID=A0A5N7IQ79_9CLOT|nr:DUF1492 domain-containing protein [Clostridium estertheticum]MBU3185644.1 DUF1492 domain-containing protein [Clostridium estertheticum]MPQ32458.1 DUF1492 domain-containing protein [Clostridium estertheticum]MPQ63117.1 DUF1492 domain-containing protein [Clostridium estertheticum]